METLLARDFMSRPVKRLTASTPLADAAAFFVRNGISGAPVVDARGRWLGVFTQRDLARFLQERMTVSRRHQYMAEFVQQHAGQHAERINDERHIGVTEDQQPQALQMTVNPALEEN